MLVEVPSCFHVGLHYMGMFCLDLIHNRTPLLERCEITVLAQKLLWSLVNDSIDSTGVLIDMLEH
jgi:hypothetical protein